MGSVDELWLMLDAQVAAGRMPGYVAALRIDGRTAVRAFGRTAVADDAPPMRPDSLFRIASVTKPIGAVLAFTFMEDGALALDDPVARWLPEAAAPRVLTARDAVLDSTVPAEREITVRDLLAGTSGWGCVLEPGPLQNEMAGRGVFPSYLPRLKTADEFAAGVMGLPLAFQPGTGWLYETGIDLLGILLTRLTGRGLGDLLAERVTGPLNMTSTGFWTTHPEHLTTAYMPEEHGLSLLDPPDGVFSRPPGFEELGSGLVSSAPDLLTFFTAMADGGGGVIGPESLRLITTPSISGEVDRQAQPFTGEGRSWGLGAGVDVEMGDGVKVAEPWQSPGRWGWTGGTGTTAEVDPIRDTVAVLLTQRAMAGPDDGFEDFWRAVAEAGRAGTAPA